MCVDPEGRRKFSEFKCLREEVTESHVFAGDLEQIALFPHLQRAVIIVSTAPF